MTPDWSMQSSYGDCPRCHRYTFIGHGPLCIDCFLNPRQTEPLLWEGDDS